LILGASAQSVIDALSFGHRDRTSTNLQSIEGWYVSGEGHTPQILSDRVILTPPTPGSTRGALWAASPIAYPEWTADVAFRASGQERGSGNLQIWYIRDGRTAAGSNSIYTVANFDGLVLSIDQYGGRGGTLRGFLNDGSTSYKDHHNVDSLAFGHCDFPYRNLGTPSRIRITNDGREFKVDIDGRLCFASDKIKLPSGYHFGISAATSENPDSFEATHFIVSTASAGPAAPAAPQANQERSSSYERTEKLPGAPQQLPDTDASTIRRQEEQFADLHNRLQGMTHQIANIFGEFERLSRTIEDRHNDLLGRIPRSSEDALGALSRRIEGIERTTERIQKDVEGRDYQQHLTNLQQAVEGVRGGLSDGLPDTLSKSKFIPNLCSI